MVLKYVKEKVRTTRPFKPGVGNPIMHKICKYDQNIGIKVFMF